jgi:hypothetical protein
MVECVWVCKIGKDGIGHDNMNVSILYLGVQVGGFDSVLRTCLEVLGSSRGLDNSLPLPQYLPALKV